MFDFLVALCREDMEPFFGPARKRANKPIGLLAPQSAVMCFII